MIKTFRTITSILIFIFFLSINSKAFADIECNPYDCAGSNAYFRVDSCTFGTSACMFQSTTPSAPMTCNPDGTPGSCRGPSPGRLGCNPPTGVSTSCSCTTPGYENECSGPGQYCGPYGGYCFGCTTTGTCSVETTSTMSCCLVTSTPPPTPPPAQENCYQCSGGSCTLYTVPQGTCSTNCSSCTSTPTPTPPGASCSVTLTPSSVSLYTDDNPYNITAVVSNVQNGTVSQVEFAKSNSNISMSPVFDTTSAYQSNITPINAGTTTLTANVYFGTSIICSTSATVTISTPPLNPPNEGPDCEVFDVTVPSVSEGDGAHFMVELSDEARNILPDGGFENGNMAYWPTSYQLGAWWTPANSVHPSPGSEGAYYAAIARQNPAPVQPPPFDPHAATGWLESGDANVQGQTYTFKFLARSHEWVDPNPQGHVRIPGLLIQSDTWGGAWAPWPELVNYEWREFSYDLTISGGTPTSRLRAVLRPPENYPNPWRSITAYNTWPIYYDSVKVYKTSNAGVSTAADAVQFWALPASANPCGSGWISIGNATRIGSTNYYEIVWDTSGVTPGNYIVVVNTKDKQNRWSSGNPGLSSACPNANFDYRAACSGAQAITACVPSCGGTSCGDTNQTPSAVSNIRLNGSTSTTFNISDNPLPRNITWNAATVTSPGTISDYEIWLLPQGASRPADEAACTAASNCRVLNWTSGTSVSLPTVLPAQTNNFTIHIRAKNGCNTYGNWATKNINIFANVTGNIYDAVVSPTGNNCTMPNPTPSPLDISAGYLGMTGSTGGNVTTAPGNSYIFQAPYAPSASWTPDNDFQLTLRLDSSDPANSFYCSCPDGGGSPFNCAHTDTDSPMSNQHFFVTPVDLSNGPWWQLQEGNGYGASAYVNQIPDACENDVTAPICDANIVIQNSDSDSKSAGIPMSGGNITSNGYYTAYDGVTEPRSEDTQHTNMIKEDYEYLVKNVDLNSVQTVGNLLTSLPTGGTTYDDAEVYYNDGPLTIDFDTQTVPAGTKIVIFVDGNVTISNAGSVGDHVLTVEDGGYFGVIASGNITINNDVGNACSFPTCPSTTTNLDGVYVASGDLIIADDGDGTLIDNMFIGEGTFVGWQGIDLRRSFDNTTDPLDRAINNQYPTELFIFRPDFNENTPELLRHPNLVWQEVN